jgi:hypothetical protein
MLLLLRGLGEIKGKVSREVVLFRWRRRWWWWRLGDYGLEMKLRVEAYCTLLVLLFLLTIVGASSSPG